MSQGTNATNAMESLSSSTMEAMIIIVGSYFISLIVVYGLHMAKIIPKPLIHPLSVLGTIGLAYYGLNG
jgi:hypothetical protein